MRTIHFNTGRQYTVHGQRISATLHDDGKTVTFWDHDRMVNGEFQSECLNRLDVMYYYDRGLFKNTTRSWEDGMLPGGCNSKWEPRT